MGCWCTAPVFFIILLVLNFGATEGKRGCANFGHSCYGGMGKRGLKETKFDQEIPFGLRIISNKLHAQPKFSSLDYQHLWETLRQRILSQRRSQQQSYDRILI